MRGGDRTGSTVRPDVRFTGLSDRFDTSESARSTPATPTSRFTARTPESWQRTPSMPSGLSSSFANLFRGADKSIKDGLSSLERVMTSPVSSPIRNTPSPSQLSEDEWARKGYEYLQGVRRERAVKEASDAAWQAPSLNTQFFPGLDS